MYSRSADRRQRRHGNIALLTALLITVLLAFVALSFDVGNMYRVRTETQTGLDAAALAGASALPAGAAAAQARAADYGRRHFANAGTLGVAGADVEVGWWNRGTREFSATAPNLGPAILPAVRVRFDQPVATPFAAVGGNAASTIGASATAVLGGPARAACGFPLVLPDCLLSDAARVSCDVCLQMHDNNSDNAAWTSFNFGSGDSDPGPGIARALTAACFRQGAVAIDASGTCAGQCSARPAAESEIGLNNGNLMNRGANGFCLLIERLLTRDGAQAPTPFTVEVPVIRSGVTTPGSCGQAQLTGNKHIEGFALVDIYGVRCSNSSDAVITAGAVPPSCDALGSSSSSGGGGKGKGSGGGSGGGETSYTPPSGKFLLVALHRDQSGRCDQTRRPVPGGGAFFGTFGRPVLVE